MSISVSVLTLMAISVERYQAIVHPLKFTGTKQRARILILSVWILSILLVLPGWIFLLQSLIPFSLFYRCNYDDTYSSIRWSNRNNLSHLVIIPFNSFPSNISSQNLVVNGMHILCLIFSINCTYHSVYLLFHCVLWCIRIRVLHEFFGVHYQVNMSYMMKDDRFNRIDYHFHLLMILEPVV